MVFSLWCGHLFSSLIQQDSASAVFLSLSVFLSVVSSLFVFFLPLFSLSVVSLFFVCYTFSPSDTIDFKKREKKKQRERHNEQWFRAKHSHTHIDILTHLSSLAGRETDRPADRQGPNYPCCVEHEISKLLNVAALAWLLKGYCDIFRLWNMVPFHMDGWIYQAGSCFVLLLSMFKTIV